MVGTSVENQGANKCISSKIGLILIGYKNSEIQLLYFTLNKLQSRIFPVAFVLRPQERAGGRGRALFHARQSTITH